MIHDENGRTRDSVVDDERRRSLTEEEVARLRSKLNDGSLDDGASRLKWFLLGFLAALVALVVASIAFLVVSDDDDDGSVDVDVPTVEVDG